jgi:hypothetical protein
MARGRLACDSRIRTLKGFPSRDGLASVAQLAEYLICNQVVAGSTPAASSLHFQGSSERVLGGALASHRSTGAALSENTNPCRDDRGRGGIGGGVPKGMLVRGGTGSGKNGGAESIETVAFLRQV